MIDRNEMEQLIRNAKAELQYLPKVPLYVHVKDWINKNIRGLLVAPCDMISWPKGCLAVGLLAQGETEAVLEYYEKWKKKKNPVYLVDDMLMGQAFLQLGEAVRNGKKETKASFSKSLWDTYSYDQAMHQMMAFLYAHDKDEKGSLPYRPLHKNYRIFADGIGMICPFACGYGVKYRDKEAVKLAVRQIVNFFQYGMDEVTGLPYHVYKYRGEESSEKLGLLGWGRSVGWIAYGLAASLEMLEKDKETFREAYDTIYTYLEKLLQAAGEYVRPDGLFASSLMEKDAPVDTSASAMILYAYRYYGEIPKGERENPDQQAFRMQAQQICDRGMLSLETYCKDGKVLQAQSECLDIGVYGTNYDSYPWSLGMAMRVLHFDR